MRRPGLVRRARREHVTVTPWGPASRKGQQAVERTGHGETDSDPGEETRHQEQGQPLYQGAHDVRTARTLEFAPHDSPRVVEIDHRGQGC